MPHRPLSHRHVAPDLPAVVLTALTLLFATLTVVRGADYATASAPAGGSLAVLQALGSIRLWGVLLILAGLNLWVSYVVVRRHFLVWLAHVLAAALYGGMAVAIAQAGTLGASYAPIVAPVGGFLWHFVIGTLTGPAPGVVPRFLARIAARIAARGGRHAV